jgi:hypothetical protein
MQREREHQNWQSIWKPVKRGIPFAKKKKTEPSSPLLCIPGDQLKWNGCPLLVRCFASPERERTGQFDDFIPEP